MTAPVYPTALPCFNATPYRIAPKSNTLKSDMESGQTRMRRMVRNYPVTIEVEAIMTRAQAALFWGFWNYDAQLGATAVYIPLLAEDGTLDARLVRIIPDPKAESLGGNLIRITLSLLTLQSNGLNQEAYQLCSTGGSIDTLEFLAACGNPLATLVNATMPQELGYV